MTFKAHFSTLIRKNFISWKRGWCGSICELLFPILFVFILVYARMEIDVEVVE